MKNICSHSIAVAELEHRLPEVCSKVRTNPKRRAKELDAGTGRKPSENRRKRKYKMKDDEEDMDNYFKGVQHNNEDFTIVDVCEVENVSDIHKFKQSCYECNKSFPVGEYRRVPHDIIIMHPEKWYHKGKVSSHFTSRYYCVSKKCLTDRFGKTFINCLLNGPKLKIKEGLNLERAHKTVLRRELGMNVE